MIFGKIESTTDKNLEFLDQLANPEFHNDSEPDLARKKCPKITWSDSGSQGGSE